MCLLNLSVFLIKKKISHSPNFSQSSRKECVGQCVLVSRSYTLCLSGGTDFGCFCARFWPGVGLQCWKWVFHWGRCLHLLLKWSTSLGAAFPNSEKVWDRWIVVELVEDFCWEETRAETLGPSHTANPSWALHTQPLTAGAKSICFFLKQVLNMCLSSRSGLAMGWCFPSGNN